MKGKVEHLVSAEWKAQCMRCPAKFVPSQESQLLCSECRRRLGLRKVRS